MVQIFILYRGWFRNRMRNIFLGRRVGCLKKLTELFGRSGELNIARHARHQQGFFGGLKLRRANAQEANIYVREAPASREHLLLRLTA